MQPQNSNLQSCPKRESNRQNPENRKSLATEKMHSEENKNTRNFFLFLQTFRISF